MPILKNQLKDFAYAGLTLVWQRQLMFFGAAFMMGYYINIKVAVFCYLLILINEIIDFQIFKHILKWNGRGAKTAKWFLHLLILNSSFGAIIVCVFIIIMANKEGNPLHFTPLFLLFAAGLFAAMNNHQLLKVLLVRLGFYGGTFIYIPSAELWKMYVLGEEAVPAIRQSIETSLWLQFFTVLFVLYFIVDCSRIFLRMYRKGQNQKTAIELERDRAKQAYVLQSQFVSVVSHELRTPLTSIKGGLGLIESGALGEVPPKIKSITAIAFKNSIRLGALINDLLDVQKFEFGKMELKLDQVNLASLVKDSVESNQTFDQSLNVTFNMIDIDTPVNVEGDYNRLMQVMANVLSNAVKFSNQDGTIDIWIETFDQIARISVRDYGSGIPENSKGKVFGQFSQVDGSKERKIGGSGLGMYITKKIMDAHKGSIDYVSELNEGTTFFVTIPLSEQK
ncbi:MAG: HAMP domain-containing histidine kinase [Amylibacter sp.]|nr:HAMP domain-containing histidine kinase [Amylibacter sp.]